MSAAAANDFWALDVVTAAAWYHSERRGCLGYTFTTNGRASCGNCGWRVAARLDDAQFAMLALARIGQTLACAQDIAEAYVHSEYGPPREGSIRLDGNGGISFELVFERNGEPEYARFTDRFTT